MLKSLVFLVVLFYTSLVAAEKETLSFRPPTIEDVDQFFIDKWGNYSIDRDNMTEVAYNMTLIDVCQREAERLAKLGHLEISTNLYNNPYAIEVYRFRNISNSTDKNLIADLMMGDNFLNFDHDKRVYSYLDTVFVTKNLTKSPVQKYGIAVSSDKSIFGVFIYPTASEDIPFFQKPTLDDIDDFVDAYIASMNYERENIYHLNRTEFDDNLQLIAQKEANRLANIDRIEIGTNLTKVNYLIAVMKFEKFATRHFHDWLPVTRVGDNFLNFDKNEKILDVFEVDMPENIDYNKITANGYSAQVSASGSIYLVLIHSTSQF